MVVYFFILNYNSWQHSAMVSTVIYRHLDEIRKVWLTFSVKSALVDLHYGGYVRPGKGEKGIAKRN